MKGVWVSKKLYENKELTSAEKEFLLWLDFLEVSDSCGLKDKELIEKLKTNKNNIHETITSLIDKGFLEKRDRVVRKTEKAKGLEKWLFKAMT